MQLSATSGGAGHEELAAPPGEGRGGGAPEPEPALTLEDVKALTTESDFSRFLAPKVPPEVKNAALKKLFADPRFNAMDGMDVYVDDYTKSEPIPESMLRKLATAQFLRLFEEKKEQDSASGTRDVADGTSGLSVAQSAETTEAVKGTSVDDDPDLRLQQDDAAQGPEPGRDTG